MIETLKNMSNLSSTFSNVLCGKSCTSILFEKINFILNFFELYFAFLKQTIENLLLSI